MSTSSIGPEAPVQPPQIQKEHWYNKVLQWFKDLLHRIGGAIQHVFGFSHATTPSPTPVSSHQFRSAGPHPDYSAICKTLSHLKVELKASISKENKTHLLETFGIRTLDGTIALDKLEELINKMAKEPEFTPSVILTAKNTQELGPELLKFLQEVNDFFLIKAFADVAHVPQETTIAEGSKIVREWLKSPEAQNMTTLNLSNKNLLFVPQEAFQLKNVEDLRLNGNKLFDLSPDIQYLKKLRMIDLSDNQFTRFPSCESKNLLILKMTGNPIEEMPEHFRDGFPHLCAWCISTTFATISGHSGHSVKQLAQSLGFANELSEDQFNYFQKEFEKLC
jgi:hypothetical protein